MIVGKQAHRGVLRLVLVFLFTVQIKKIWAAGTAPNFAYGYLGGKLTSRSASSQSDVLLSRITPSLQTSANPEKIRNL